MWRLWGIGFNERENSSVFLTTWKIGGLWRYFDSKEKPSVSTCHSTQLPATPDPTLVYDNRSTWAISVADYWFSTTTWPVYRMMGSLQHPHTPFLRQQPPALAVASLRFPRLERGGHTPRKAEAAATVAKVAGLEVSGCWWWEGRSINTTLYFSLHCLHLGL